MENELRINHVVALLKDIPANKLTRGQVGTIVEILDNNYFEVEFCNTQGETVLQLPLNRKDLLHLHYEPELV